MDDRGIIRRCLDAYRAALLETDVSASLLAARDLLLEMNRRGGKMILAGNGASAAISAHAALDFSKQARTRAMTIGDAAAVTALANDHGYESWISKALDLYADEGDVVVLISSSGRSANVVQAARHARQRGLSLVTFSGFAADNPLRAHGDINFWVDSRAYNVVENVHSIWLMMVCDLIIGTEIYPTS